METETLRPAIIVRKSPGEGRLLAADAGETPTMLCLSNWLFMPTRKLVPRRNDACINGVIHKQIGDVERVNRNSFILTSSSETTFGLLANGTSIHTFIFGRSLDTLLYCKALAEKALSQIDGEQLMTLLQDDKGSARRCA